MIITLTPNPSVDRTLRIAQLRFNENLRTQDTRVDWGGKGFNVSRALRILDQETLALAWVGGGTGKMLKDGLEGLGIRTDFVWVPEDTRTNTLAQEEAGEWYIRLIEAGPHIPEDAIQALLDKADAYANANDIWVASGSLPPDVPEDFYASLIRLLKAKGVRMFFDTNDEPLRRGLSEAPFLIKPDLTEVAKITGITVTNYEEAKSAALPFLHMGVQHVAISIGNLGVLLASQNVILLATPPKMATRNVTGAGDAVMAGLAYGFSQNMPLNETARWAAAFGAVVISKELLASVSLEELREMLPRVEVRTVNVM
ncbi:MAG: 1-phosphofructokinase family hexose kinase [Anaerolineaceae bacterium]